MKKSQIEKLEDKDLQLRYFLGGLRQINDEKDHLCDYWTCNIDCSCLAVPSDERLSAVKSFIQKHNLTNERFLKLAYNYLIGSIMKYCGLYSCFFRELEEVLEPYHFIHTEVGRIPENDFRERELEQLVCYGDDNSFICLFIKKYNLTLADFIILAKTSLNHNFYSLDISNPDDTFLTEIVAITHGYGLNVSKGEILRYRENYKVKQESIEKAENMLDELGHQNYQIQKKNNNTNEPHK